MISSNLTIPSLKQLLTGPAGIVQGMLKVIVKVTKLHNYRGLSISTTYYSCDQKTKMLDGNPKALIGPSVLNSDLSRLYEESQKLLNNGADYLHLDVMDGHFVPNLTFGHPVVKCLRSKIKDAFFETHMMVSKPEQWIVPMADAGVNLYTFHIEPVQNVEELCRKIKENGMQVGIAIKPGTPVAEVEKYIKVSDMVLVMTVEPGFGGQKFMNEQMEKVKHLRNKYPLLNIEVDGGVGPSTIQCCADAGANMIVSGSAVIGSDDQAKTMKLLKTTVQTAIEKKH